MTVRRLLYRRRKGFVRAFSPLHLSPALWLLADEGLYTGGARQFTAANSEFLSIADNAALSANGSSITISLFVYPDSVTGTRILLGKSDNAAQTEYLIWVNGTDINFTIYDTVTGTTTVAVASILTINTWHHIIATVDNAGDKKPTLYINNGSATQGTSYAGTTINSTAQFTIGARGDAALFCSARIAKVGFWKRTLTAAENTYLFNLKNGRLAGELGIPGTDGAALADVAGGSLPSYWNLNEASGIAIDAIGTNDLTDNNTVTSANGPESEIASDSVGSNHGVLTNFANPATAWSSDRPTPIAALVEGSLEFYGSNCVIVLNGAASISSDESHSVSFWAKYDSFVTVPISWAAATSNYIAVNDVGAIQWEVGNSSRRSYANNLLSTGIWYHIVSVKTAAGDNGTLYLNGVAITPSSGVIATTPAATNMLLGVWTNLSSNAMDGKISDLRVYNSSLSAGQVAELFAGSEATGATPTARWPLDDGPQTGLVDGDPVIRKSSSEGSYIDFEQAEPEKRLARSTTAIPGMVANGTNNGLVHVGTISTSTDGTYSRAFRTGASAFVADQILDATADEAVANKYLKIGRNLAGKCFIEVNDSGTIHRVTGNTVLSNSTSYILTITSSGTAWAMWVNGVAQTLTVTTANSGKWFGAISGRDNVSQAMLKTTTESEWFEGTLGGMVLYDNELTAPQRSQVETYLADEAGISL